ncbi:Signal transduction histidine kinase [Peptoclostridium litorale DSM 5388]|uniref:histidine kinase n=1 Tax=Peptoclostridium litorale DSM 5388 TaxID=1121324 RepID=A0A069RD81_PEPLI|nr:HAMP domain-containing sensor histidine kinase [Peptoclostridium litorale]KDR95001.1 sensor protein VanSB [Peptoclostridium litorale DSM 5388]SIN76754.1 Signal transduction histidine kinase [Peptoclostridium litorale DSM 5388]
MKKSIVAKLFIVTTVAFMAFLAFELVVQTIFFDSFYVTRKIENTEKSMDEFANSYIEGKGEQKLFKSEVKRFNENNNAVIAVSDEKGQPKTNEFYGIDSNTSLIVDGEGKVYNIDLIGLYDAIKDDEAGFESIKVGQTLAVKGINYDSGLVYSKNDGAQSSVESYNEDEQPWIEPYYIKIGGFEYNDGYVLDEVTENAEVLGVDGIIPRTIDIEGEIVYLQSDVLYEEYGEVADYKYWMLLDEIDAWFYESAAPAKSNGIHRYSFTDEMTGNENMVFVKKIAPEGGGTEYLFAMITLQQVDEAIVVLKDYYVYMFFAAIIFILILSYFYTRVITRPLIVLNDTAGKMAQLDFSVKCNIKSSDEMGSLADSLNNMSARLRATLGELERANEELQADIDAKTRQEKARKDFIASASHELKTPLSIIKSYAEGIKDGIYSEKSEYYLDVIVDEIDKMNAMVFEMLEISKIESEKIEIEKSDFCIEDMMLRVHEKLRCMADEKNMQVIMDVSRVRVHADEKRIKQVIINLYSNAIRYSPVGESICISTEQTSGGMVFSIENTGAHIPKEHMDRIWEGFYRVEKSRSRELGGSGLGLFIVKNILEQHESEFGVENTEKGVKFWFEVERVEE